MSRRFGRFVPQSTIVRRMDAKDLRFQAEARRQAALRAARLSPEVVPFVEVTRIPASAPPVVVLESVTISADALPHHYLARAVILDLQPSQMVAALVAVEAAIQLQHPHAVRTGWRACSDSLRVYFSAWSPSLTQ
jgi:hypothetical protein